MSDASERAAEAAETLTRLATESAAREQVWRERADLAQISADAALERERAAASAARAQQLALLAESAAATRTLAVATLAVSLRRSGASVFEAVRLAHEALFGAEGRPR